MWTPVCSGDKALAGSLLTDETLARFSAACYQGGAALQTAAEPFGWYVSEKHGTGPHLGQKQRAYVLRSNGAACLVFRGTVPTSLADWLVNFRVRKKITGWGKVHAGAFYRASRLYRRLAPNLGNLSHLYITGHSLGGQMALVAAHCYWRGARYPVDVVTFGAPRALSWCAKRCFPEYIAVRQYHHRRDPVGYVPTVNYWHLNPVRFGRVGVPFHRPFHGSERYVEWVKLLSQ